MRITRLHLLLLTVGLACAGFGGYTWWKMKRGLVNPSQLPTRSSPAAVVSKPNPTTSPIAKSATSSPGSDAASSENDLQRQAAREVANAGVLYENLHRQYGVIPDIAAPVRTAKRQLAEGRYELARLSAKQAVNAIKDFSSGATPATYRVVRGDTLWAIARDHSPIRQGPGWVAIWHANERAIRNFDHVDAGTALVIPQDPKQYVTRYWSPRVLRTQTALAMLTVNVAELPKPRDPNEIDVAELPIPQDPLTVDLAELPISMENVPVGFIYSALPPPTSRLFLYTDYR